MASTPEFSEGKTIHRDRWQLLLGIPCSLFRIRRDLVMSLDIARFLLEKFLTLGMGNGEWKKQIFILRCERSSGDGES